MSNPNSPKHGLQKRKTVTQEKKIAEDEFMAAAIGDVEWLRQSLRGQKGVINFDRNVSVRPCYYDLSSMVTNG